MKSAILVQSKKPLIVADVELPTDLKFGQVLVKIYYSGICGAQINEIDAVKGPDKFPLESGRWGYLPVEMQKFLHESNADCQISKNNSGIKQNHPCLLRHGVEVNQKQSFIACISDVLFFGKRIVRI